MHTLYFIDVQYSFQTGRHILNILICDVYFSDNFNSVFLKKVYETYRRSSSIEWQEKGTDWIFRIFTFNDKNSLYLPMILRLQFFWESKWSRSNPFSNKTTYHIPNIKNSEFKLKKMPGFFKAPFIFH